MPMDNELVARKALRRVILLLAILAVLLAFALFVPGGIGWWHGQFLLTILVFEVMLGVLYLARKTLRFSLPEAKSAGAPNPGTR